MLASLIANLVVTHTDAPELFVWDTDKQPHRKTRALRPRIRQGRARSHGRPLQARPRRRARGKRRVRPRRHGGPPAAGLRRKRREGSLERRRPRQRRRLAGPRATRRLPDASKLRRGRAKRRFRRRRPALRASMACPFEDTKTRWRTSRSTPSRNKELCSVACDRSLIFWDGRAGNGARALDGGGVADDLTLRLAAFLDEHAVLTLRCRRTAR